jgi:hypothetical protein
MGHPKRTWETDAAPISATSGDERPSAESGGGRKNSFVEIMRTLRSKNQLPNSTHTSSNVSTKDSIGTSSSLKLYNTTQSQEPMDRPRRSKKCFWPRDLLPLDLPEARILTYGYDADVLGPTQGGETNLHNFTKHGQDLLVHLEREIPQEVSRVEK